VRGYNSAAFVCAALILFGAGNALATEEGDGEEPVKWSGEVEASASQTTGNTENTQLGLKAKFKREIGRFIHVLSGKVDYAEQVANDEEGEEYSKITQDRWMISYQVDAQLRDRTHGYVRGQYDEDQFSGFNKRWFVGVGLGHDVFDNDQVTWSIEGGPGYRWSELAETPTTPGEPRARHEFAAYADSDLNVQLRENVSLEQNANVTYADSNTTYDTAVGLKTKLTDTLSSKVSYQVKYETDPPDGRKNKDTMLKASLLLGF